MDKGIPVEAGYNEHDIHSVVHSLPCNIHYDGRAAVSLYFRPTTVHNNSEDGRRSPSQDDHKNSPISVIAQFRGRQLKGKKYHSLKKGSAMKGLVLEKSSNKIAIDSTFDEIHVWGHDLEPCRENPIQKAVDWGRLSTALHSAIPLE